MDITTRPFRRKTATPSAPKKSLEEILAGIQEQKPKKKDRRAFYIFLALILLLFLLVWIGLLILGNLYDSQTVTPNIKHARTPNGAGTVAGLGTAGLNGRPGTGGTLPSSLTSSDGALFPYSEVTTSGQVADLFPPFTAAEEVHIRRTLKYIYKQINPDTGLAYSLPGDRRLLHWGVVYDNAMRIMVHIRTGDIPMAERSMNYFMNNIAIQREGWVYHNGRLVRQFGWIVNIVDSAEGRSGGRGVEHISHAGPNIYLGLAAAHLYRATGKQRYLDFAKSRWQLVKGLQNEDPNDFNYGGVRMGPMGSHLNPREQKLGFITNNPSWYNIYNGEHAADFRGLSLLLYQLEKDPKYVKAANLIAKWDQNIYDEKRNLFYIGTTEKGYYDANIGEWVDPGIIPMYPLDTQALKLSAYGVDGMEIFEKNAAEKVRQAVDDQFKVTVQKTNADGSVTPLTGYDFVGHRDRARLILYEEQGPNNDVKVNKGNGRDPIMSDEWSNWVALADLKLANDFFAKGDLKRAKKYADYYVENALNQGIKSAHVLPDNSLAYPYAQPIPYALNKPVGFGWNTHHQPYSVIGGIGRTMGILRFDPFHFEPPSFTINVRNLNWDLAQNVPTDKMGGGLVTEAEVILNRAWSQVSIAQTTQENPEQHWLDAVGIVEGMLRDHPDWVRIAKTQNAVAARSEEKYPLWGLDGITIAELEPLYRDYWALYHVGTAEFIRFMSYSELAKYFKSINQPEKQARYKNLASDAAEKIINNYFYSQSYDLRGWMWQPVNSMMEYLGLYRYSPHEYVSNVNPARATNQEKILDGVMESIESQL